jgi:proline dehydrogenase
MKRTIYGQFVAGGDLETLRPMMEKLRSYGIRSILDYAVEDDVQNKDVYMEVRQKDKLDATHQDAHTPPQFHISATPGTATIRSSARTYFYQDEHKCDENMQHFLKCINVAADASQGEDAFAAIKLTGLGRTEFLLKLSEALVGTERVFRILADKPSLLDGRITADSFLNGIKQMKIDAQDIDHLFKDLDGGGSISFLHWYNLFQPGRELYQILSSNKYSTLQPRIPLMSDIEKDQMKSVMRRMETLSDAAQSRGVRLMVDAEQTYYQPAIRHITVHRLMPKYNLQSPVIYNTQQCYLKGVEESIALDLLTSTVTGFHYGVKLVRGAYMEQEKALALKKGYDSPIWDVKSDTDVMYHKVLENVMEKMKDGRVHVMVATHNEDTIKFAIDKMISLNVDRQNVAFGQLLGMCDHVTYLLGMSGYSVYKYMPYGPVEEAIPYLLRRANENKGMLAGAVRERELLSKEIKRRIAE